MKANIVGSTPRFRALLADDLHALKVQQRTLISHLAADHGGRMVQEEGDGYWLEFTSVTDAVRAGIAIQEALRVMQPGKGDDRLSMRVVVGLGDVTSYGGDLTGEVFALVSRIEDITPPDEIYLTSAARLALLTAEIQTDLVGSFALQGFDGDIPVYRVATRHRTHVLPETYILISDLRSFTPFSSTASIADVECVLDTLDVVTKNAALKYGGRILFNRGDGHLLAFPDACLLVAASEQIAVEWQACRNDYSGGIQIVLHCGDMKSFRSYLYGNGIATAYSAKSISQTALRQGEGAIFVTGALRDKLSSEPWHNRLHPTGLKAGEEADILLEIFRLEQR